MDEEYLEFAINIAHKAKEIMLKYLLNIKKMIL